MERGKPADYFDEDGGRITDWIPAFPEVFDGIGLSVDLFPYTPDELSKPLAEQALASGMALFDRHSSP